MTEDFNEPEELLKTLTSTSISEQEVFPHPSSIPRTLIKSFRIDDIQTDVWIQVFRERLVFGVSQHQGSLGSFVMCEPTQSPIHMKQIHYEVTNLLGAREDVAMNVYAQQLCEKIITARGAGQPLLTIVLGITLHKTKGKEPAMFRAILDVLVKLYRDAMQE